MVGGPEDKLPDQVILIRARQKLEFQLALRASKSQNSLARANFPLARVKKNRFLMLINNS